MDSRLSRWCEGLIEAGWLVAILAVPLFFNIHSERVFEPDKIALLRSIAVVMATAWLVRLIDTRGWRDLSWLRWSNTDAVWHKPFVLPALLLAVLYGLSTLFSVSSRISWAGSYQRLQGTYTAFTYLAIFGLMAATIRSPAQVRRVVTVAIITSIPVSLYGILQHFGHDPLPWGGNVQVRVAGHLGNAIFIAAYLIMVTPLTLARIIESSGNILNDEQLSVADVIRASVYIFILAIQILTIYWSGSRGPLIGLAVGLFSFILVLLVSLRDTTHERERSRRRETAPALFVLVAAVMALIMSFPVTAANPLLGFITFTGLVALIVLVLFILAAARRGRTWLWLGWILLTVFLAGWLLLFNIPVDRTSPYRQIPVVGGVVETLDAWRELPVIGSYGKMLDPTNTTGREKSGRVRVLIWTGVIDLLRPHEPLQYPDGRADPFNWLRPLIGYGPESMYVVYNAFYPPELATVESRNASPDRSHNETFDTLIITGLAGLLAWQALYLSVIYFAFRYLGVVRTKRDGWMLVGLWITGALLAGLVAIYLIDPLYLGVAIPTGIILSVVTYLIYFALFSERHQPNRQGPIHAPSVSERLLMNALTAAVLAHYVEIHFGIAISATRLYFYVFIALMFALGYRSQDLASAEITEPIQPPVGQKKQKRKGRRPTRLSDSPVAGGSPSVWPELGFSALLMALMVGILGYSFVTYALPPGRIISGPADLPVIEIFRQSFLRNARLDFVDWPFVYSMIVLSWLLGWVVILGEMAKDSRLPHLSNGRSRLTGSRRLAAAVYLLILALVGLGMRLFLEPTSVNMAFGQSMAAIAAVPFVGAAILLFANRPLGRLLGGILGMILMILAVPILINGFGGGIVSFLPAFLTLLAGGGLLWLLWDNHWRNLLWPITGYVVLSFLMGIGYTFLHASRYRSILFFRPVGTLPSAAELRALEAIQSGTLLLSFYAFLFLMLILMAWAISWTHLSSGRRMSMNRLSIPTVGMLVVVSLAAIILVLQSNYLPIQADMIFKRARPFDEQATRSVQADTTARIEAWDAAIATYGEAISRMPTEDYYYLFQSRALLERAGLTANADDRAFLLNVAESLLLRAQQINPLNTDHTANLARLNTRWYATVEEPTEKQERLALAERHYQRALVLSPQNSLIRNEYARLILELSQDCPRALALYDESAQIDPYYAQTHLSRADAYIICSSSLAGAERDASYRAAAAALEDGLRIDPSNIRAWVQLAEIWRQLDEFSAALEATAQARAQNNPIIFPPEEIDLMEARVLAELGDDQTARALAEQALETAAGSVLNEILDFLNSLDTGGE
jgi:tetratricopeptide (TPR) repeat protein